MKLIFLLGLVFTLGACRTARPSTPAPTPIAIQVTYPSVLQAWVEKLSNCASENPRTAIYTFQTDNTNKSVFSASIELMLGEPAEQVDPAYLWKVGDEQIVVIVNTANDLEQLSRSQLQSIFSGQTLRWNAGVGLPIQVWVPLDGDPSRVIFERAVLQPESLTSEALLAPDPNAMLESISSQEGAIGYLPLSIVENADSKLREKIRLIELETSLTEALTHPVLAATQEVPQGAARDLLACLQGSTP